MANRAYRLVQMSLKQPESNPRSRRRLNYGDESLKKVKSNFYDEAQDESIEYGCEPLEKASSTSLVSHGVTDSQIAHQLHQNDAMEVLKPALTLSGLNSLIGSPRSLKSVDFIASPSAIYKNDSLLPDISNVDLFFDKLVHEIENNDTSPEQTCQKLCVKALISDVQNDTESLSPSKNPTTPTICTGSINNFEVDNTEAEDVLHQPNNFSKTIESQNQDMTVSYVSLVEPKDQVLIDMPLVEENQSIVIIEVVTDQSIINEVAVDGEETTNIENTSCVGDNLNESDIARSDDEAQEEITVSTIEASGTDNFANNAMVEDCSSETFQIEKSPSAVILSRKRKVNRSEWSDVKNKKLKNSGQQYKSVRSHVLREAKSIKATCTCRRKCFEKIDSNSRKEIFGQYWELGDHGKQWEWILRHITASSIKKMQLERKNNRTQTILYKLPKGTDGKEIVCKKMFVQTLGIAEKTVYTAIEKQNSTMLDLRGKHLNRPRKMQEDTEDSIIEHIKEFPAIESHYTRKRSAKVYLSEDLNISKMYRLYKAWFATKNVYHETKMASKSQYELLFNTKFNISFFRPKKDQCETCTIYRNADEERKLQLKENYERHIEEKDEVRAIKNLEKSTPGHDNKTVACFDLEKVLHIPQSEVSTCYYKRKYAIYNFTTFDLKHKKGYCYLWHQQIAKRGANEIGSCLWSYINEAKNNGSKEISFYSDACTGQNRNRFIFAMYQYACKTLDISITHRFFVSGHSQSEGDTMHSCIERAKKNQTIYTPDQMYFIIENSKVEGEKFIIKEMAQGDFFNMKRLVNVKGKNWNIDDDNQKVYWSKIREVAIYTGDGENIYFKYKLSEPAKCISTNKVTTSSRRKRRVTPAEIDQPMEQAYTEPIPIPTLLHKDLMSLCNAGIIPDRYQGFYKSLIAQNSQLTQITDNDSDDDDDE